MADTNDMSFLGDVEPLLPDGWDGESDIFADAEEVNEPIEGADEYRTDNEMEDLLKEDEPAEDKATEETSEVPTTDEEPEPKPEPPAPSGRKLKLKVNHQEREVDLNSMSDDELVALMQKGYAFDEVKDRERRETYDRVLAEEKDLGMSDRIARMAAAAAAGKDFSQADEEPEASASSNPEPGTQQTGRDINDELRQLRIVRPSLKSIPDEVARMVAAGVNVTQAYLAWEAENNRKAADKLKKENEVLKQNAASAARAPVTGVTGGGATTGKPVSKFDEQFMKGFDEGNAW